MVIPKQLKGNMGQVKNGKSRSIGSQSLKIKFKNLMIYVCIIKRIIYNNITAFGFLRYLNILFPELVFFRLLTNKL